ncbi:MAG: response regulator [Candidatus Marinimicrobia bacterium]|nr:response regulator [Candidatus Neomarinimicrobiota bacterium]
MKYRVLIIDDEPDLRRLLARAVASFGYDVQCADDGRAGAAICQTWAPHLVLTDIFMPEQDGLETIRWLRKAAPDIKVVVMSGGGGVGDLSMLRAARALGALQVLAKPFDLADLKTTLAAHLPPPDAAGA